MVQQDFQNSRHNLSENELRSLFVAKEGEAFSYPASISNFVLVMQNFLVILHYFKMFIQAGVLHNYTKVMLLGFRIFKKRTFSFGILQFPPKVLVTRLK